MNTATPLTAADLLQVGYWFQRHDQAYQITAWDAAQPLKVEARSTDGVLHTFALTELFAPTPPTRFGRTQQDLSPKVNSQHAVSASIADGAHLSEHLLKRADRIIQTIDSVQKQIDEEIRRHQLAQESYALTDLTRRACQALPIPISLPNYYLSIITTSCALM